MKYRSMVYSNGMPSKFGRLNNVSLEEMVEEVSGYEFVSESEEQIEEKLSNLEANLSAHFGDNFRSIVVVAS